MSNFRVEAASLKPAPAAAKQTPRPIQVDAPPIGDTPFDLEDVQIQGDVLKVKLSHGGGAAPHDFAMSRSGGFFETMPVQVDLKLSHDGHGDRAEAYVIENLSFDLAPLKKEYQAAYRQEHGTIALNLGGKSVQYTF